MRNNKLILVMLIPLLASCSKTKELYRDYAYNSSNFMENYYVEQNGVDKLEVASVTSYALTNGLGYTSLSNISGIRTEDNPENRPYRDELNKESEYGRNNNMSLLDESFAYGYLSKLYDGRIWCEGKYELSRVQIDKNGYSSFFPKMLENYKFFSISLRGATDYYKDSLPSPLKDNCVIDLHIKFYRHITNSNEYNVTSFDLIDVPIPCDDNSRTNLVTVYLADDITVEGTTYRKYNYELSDTVAMSMSFDLKTTKEDLSSDCKEEKDHHFAVMLYEVLFPKSTWR